MRFMKKKRSANEKYGKFNISHLLLVAAQSLWRAVRYLIFHWLDAQHFSHLLTRETNKKENQLLDLSPRQSAFPRKEPPARSLSFARSFTLFIFKAKKCALAIATSQ